MLAWRHNLVVSWYRNVKLEVLCVYGSLMMECGIAMMAKGLCGRYDDCTVAWRR